MQGCHEEKNGATLVLLLFYEAFKAPKRAPKGFQKVSKSYYNNAFRNFHYLKVENENLKIGRSPPLSQHCYW